MRARSLALAFLLACPQVIGAAEGADALPQRGYSVTTLRQPIFDSAQVAIETTALNNWLNANIKRLSSEQMSGPREHLYYLIDSRVKQLYAESGQVLPKSSDLILELLFSWSESLGVYGGTHAFNSVRSSTSQARNPEMSLPTGISLSLEEDLFTVQSTLAWKVTFPYYFMLWEVGDFIPIDGKRTQLLSLSTGAAKDKSKLGHSQATLMFLFSPESSLEEFQTYWKRMLELGTEPEARPLGVRGLQAQHVMVEASNLHKEFTAWADSTGSYAVVYLGIDGTYEWNRPHFLDFLRSIESQSPSRPN